jgi:hypothetical protein
MDLAQIAEMKDKITEELRQIEGLKQSMEHTLAGLIEWEGHLQSSAPNLVKSSARRPATIEEVQPKPQAPVKPAIVSPIERVSRALKEIHGEFTRSQLLAQTEGDGKGEISIGAYSSIFSRLLGNRRIECVKGTVSQRDSLYMKSGEKKPSEAQGTLVGE